MLVCTPSWLVQKLRTEGGIVSGRNYIFVEEYDIVLIREFIVDYAEQCCGETWAEVGERLGRLCKWEFEDYQPFSANQ